VTLDQFVKYRNDFAHGLGALPTPSLDEFRAMLTRCAVMVRFAIRYCSEPAGAAGSMPRSEDPTDSTGTVEVD
jgi:hypothetical protein